MDYTERLDSIQSRQAEAETADWHAAWLAQISQRSLEDWQELSLEDFATDAGALLEAGLEPAIGWPCIGALLRRLAGYRTG